MQRISSSSLTARSSSSFDYEDEFKTFQEAETQLWRDRGVERLQEELIPASENIIAASLAHRLHNPSFTTIKVRNRSTADSSDPCTAIVRANGFDDKTIIMDHVAQGKVKDPFIYYPKDILAYHEQHLSIIRDHMLAPLEVIYGVPTWTCRSTIRSSVLRRRCVAEQVDVLPCAYFAANKPYEHESGLALKALHALSLTDADPELRKRSIRLLF